MMIFPAFQVCDASAFTSSRAVTRLTVDRAFASFGALHEVMSEGRPGKVIPIRMMIFSIADVSRCVLRVELVSQIEFSCDLMRFERFLKKFVS